MKKIITLTLMLSLTLAINAQETMAIYQKAVRLLKKTKEFKDLNISEVTASSQSISFTNQAYAFWLDGLDTRFKDKDFENFYGDLYRPITIETFKEVREQRRSRYQLYVSETEDDLFVIELLSRKRKQKAKYPKFYQGSSISFLFEKTATSVRLIETIKLQNN